jgi:ABC-type branched-subunit amino acid transport system substrate-binding protein
VRRTPAAAVAVGALLLATGCTGDRSSAGEVLVVVSAPLSTSPWIGRAIERGARLATEQLARTKTPVRLEVFDNAGSPQTAAADARRAVDRHAAAFVTDGTGAAAVAAVSEPAGLPVFVTFQGGVSIVAPGGRRTVFRIAPANKPMSTRLADYLAEKHPRVALVSDDSSYGREGAAAMRLAFRRDEVPVVADLTVPAAASALSAQVLAARRAGATTLVLWCSAADVAAAIEAARGSGWDVAIYAGPTGEDPLVRQLLAAHADWVTGLTFVSFRITSEVGPEPFERYRSAYEKRFGAERVGVRQGGRDVVQPPDWSMFGYDTVRLVAAARAKGGGSLLEALENTTITGANGDERGFGPGQREGVSPDDMYFARFAGFVFAPVTDDVLSVGLPSVPQLR